MKRTVLGITVCVALAMFLSLGSTLYADTPTSQPASQPTAAVKGTLDIQYNTRTQKDDSGNPKEGVTNVYDLDLTVLDTIVFRGKITELPTLFSKYLGREIQQANLTYNLQILFRNLRNPQETKAVGKLVGTVPIDKNGVYQYGNGNLRIGMEAIGKAASYEASFRGTAAGKPPKDDSTFANVSKKARTMYRSVNGKTLKISVTKYDEMVFNDLTLPAGPAKVYPETHVNGKMLFDYDRNVWFFDGVTMTYQTQEGKTQTDKLSGNIRWIEDVNRKSNGLGEYQFDVRVNEPEVQNTEAAAFQPADDESSYFAVDPNVKSLIGEAKYQDTMSGETPISSKVTIDLRNNQLTRQQVVNLVKVIWFVDVVPMNAE